MILHGLAVCADKTSQKIRGKRSEKVKEMFCHTSNGETEAYHREVLGAMPGE
jgi:hypothetical protein